ncbi:sigma-70 family RNA polymerase sigma factor [Mycolicibacterium vaccae]|uniref:sigma-70 family RNA polymerase sigma factor n=1 Tax=Mycolicibacterium vaccae TaxID=1810 RepID=UPI003D085BDE
MKVDTDESREQLKARFEAEVLPLTDVLFRGARRLTHNDADAEDLLQETLLRAYTGFGSFRAGTNLQAWLFRIQYNQWINAYRWRERRPAEVLSDRITEPEVRSAETELLESLPDDDLHAAMTHLPEGFRTALYYADIEGYTCAETAVLMSIPIGTVMSRVSRARNRLRQALTVTQDAA